MAKPKAKSVKQDSTQLKKGGKSTNSTRPFKGRGKTFKKKTLKKDFKFNKENSSGQKKEVDTANNDLKKRKLEQDDVTKIKKKKKDKSELVTRLMGIYETLRRKDSTATERSKLINDVINIAEQKDSEMVLKHSTVRVLEMCVKYGDEGQREKIFLIFKENLVTLLTSKYAKFLVEKFIDYGTKEQKKKIIEAFYGKVKKLIKNKEAQSILEDLYCKYANSSQKAALVEEFYGPEFAIFKVASGRNLDQILTEEPAKKDVILKHMKETLTNVCQKDAVSLSVIHRAILDFLKYADDTQKAEVVEMLRAAILNILHTKDGAKVAMNCLWLATTKERKALTKSFKTHVKKICMEEFGHMVMFALFDVMDDTVLLKKALFPEILSNIDDLLTDQYGRKVILYILKPRATTYFLPEIVKFLEQGDGNSFSKKEPSVRQQELREALLPDLLSCMTKNIQDILRNKSHAVTLLSALEVCGELPESIELMKTIVDIAIKPIKSRDEDLNHSEEKRSDADEEGKEEEVDSPQEHIIEDASGHWVMKNLVKQDKKRQKEGCKHLFSCILCENVPTGYFADWASQNRGAFVLVSLLESGIESVVKRVKEDLKFLKTTGQNEEQNKGLQILKKLL